MPAERKMFIALDLRSELIVGLTLGEAAISRVEVAAAAWQHWAFDQRRALESRHRDTDV